MKELALNLCLTHRATARLGHGGQTHRYVCSTVPGIAIFALQKLEEEKPLRGFRIYMKQLAALGIPVVQHVELGQFAQELIIEIKPRGQVVIVVERDIQQRHARSLGTADFSKQVVTFKGNVMHT